MRKIVLAFGIIAGIINAAAGTLLVSWGGDELLHANSMWIGYLVMIISLSMVFVGVKQYRDQHLGGVISFGKAFLTGLYIALVASAVYVGAWEVYMQTSGESFIDTYQASVIQNMRNEGAGDSEIAAMEEELEYYAEIYENPFLRMLVTLSEILPVGLIITLISAALLRRSNFMPSSDNVKADAKAG